MTTNGQPSTNGGRAKAKVAVLYTKPETVLQDYERLMALAGFPMMPLAITVTSLPARSACALPS